MFLNNTYYNWLDQKTNLWHNNRNNCAMYKDKFRFIYIQLEVKSEAKKFGHFQELAINKKSTIFFISYLYKFYLYAL